MSDFEGCESIFFRQIKISKICYKSDMSNLENYVNPLTTSNGLTLTSYMTIDR